MDADTSAASRNVGAVDCEAHVQVTAADASTDGQEWYEFTSTDLGHLLSARQGNEGFARKALRPRLIAPATAHELSICPRFGQIATEADHIEDTASQRGRLAPQLLRD